MKSDLIIAQTTNRTREQLIRLQNLPLEQKINLTLRRIQQFCTARGNKVYVAFSGGKDSTVVLDLVRKIYPEAQAVFCDTGLEFPEIRKFVEGTPNTVFLKPKLTFLQVIDKYGYPVISKENSQKIHEIRTTHSDKLRNKRLFGDEKGNGKLAKKWNFAIEAPFKISHKCCDIMKKNPSKSFEKKTGLAPITGEMASESRLREGSWLKTGCNQYSGRVKSTPLSFWTDADIWEYIKKYRLPYSDIYNMGYKRTGCVYCLFGAQFDNDAGRGKFDLLKKTHPKLYSYCMENLGIKEIFKFFDKNTKLVNSKYK